MRGQPEPRVQRSGTSAHQEGSEAMDRELWPGSPSCTVPEAAPPTGHPKSPWGARHHHRQTGHPGRSLHVPFETYNPFRQAADRGAEAFRKLNAVPVFPARMLARMFIRAKCLVRDG